MLRRMDFDRELEVKRKARGEVVNVDAVAADVVNEKASAHS